ncbi:MAG: carbamate kinase [Desulfobacterales bacterium]|nr:carbamate kinase [Desulfobacterales bacterium]
MTECVVIAIGGNSLIKDENRREIDDQLEAVQETIDHIVDFIELGYDVVITHGNGPQVGFILRRSELAFEAGELHFVPLKNCVADTQGAIGYQIQESLCNVFKNRGIKKSAASVVTMVEVDSKDPSFENPTKPIGVFYSKEKLDFLQRNHPDWVMVPVEGKGYRRVVPSPLPRRIIETQAIKSMIKEGLCVIAAGGGGIPVVADEKGNLSGVNAVIDKDLSTALLASDLSADLLIILTSVANVFTDFNKSGQKALDQLTVFEAEQLIDQGQFAQGSMLPKIQAALTFIAKGGKRVIITTPENLVPAVLKNYGTHIVP